jgi:TP901 family phage tail tape measure protein
MTDRIQIEFHASANFADLQREVARANAGLGTLKNSISAIEAKNVRGKITEFEKLINQSGYYNVHSADVTAAEKKFGQQLADNKLKPSDYSRTLREHIRLGRASAAATGQQASMIQRLAREQLKIERSQVLKAGRNPDGSVRASVIRPTGLPDDLATKTELARKSYQALNTVIQQSSTKLIDWGKNTQWAGRQLMVGISIPVGIFGAAAGKAFYELDKGLTRITKVYGDLGTQLEDGAIRQLRTDVIDLSKALAENYGSSLEQTLGLAGDFAATGAQGEDLIRSTTEATRLAILGEVDRQDAMKTTLSLTSAFRVETKDLTAAIDFLNAVENQTSLSLQDLSVAIPKVGPVVKNLGGDFRDLALYLTAMKEGGVNAGEGANAIKSGLVSIINPTAKAIDYLKQFNIDLPRIVDANAGDITGTILELKAALDTLDPLTRQRALATLFQKYQVARMTALFDNIGEEGSQTMKVLELMQASAGQLGDIAANEMKTITESASGMWNRALESFKINLAAVGEEFLYIGTKALEAGSAILKWFDSLPDVVKNGVILGTVLVALAGAGIMTLGVFGNLIGQGVKFGMMLLRLKDAIRGQVTYLEILDEEMHVNKVIGDQVADVMYKQAAATNQFSHEVAELTKQLQGLYDKQAQVELGAARGSAAYRKASALTAQEAIGNYGPGQVPQAGHVLSNKVAKDFGIFGPNAKDDWGLKYGLTRVLEGSASNQGDRGFPREASASIFGQTDKIKGFDALTSMRMAAGIAAIESVDEGIRSAYIEHERKFLKADSDEAREDARNKFNTWANQPNASGIAPRQVMETQLNRFYGMYDEMYKDIAGMDLSKSSTNKAANARIKKAANALNLSVEGIHKAIGQGLIDKKTILFQLESSIRTQQELFGMDAPLVIDKQANQQKKMGHRGTGMDTLLTGNYRTADQARLFDWEEATKQDAENAKESVIVSKEAKEVIKKERKSWRQRMRSAGKFGGMGAMAAMTALPFLTETGNASVDNGINIAGGASMGAMTGMMFGPMGMAIGGAVGAIIPSVQILIDKMGEFQRTTEAAFNVGADAASRYGLKLKDLADIGLLQKEAGVDASSVKGVADSILAQEEGSADRNLADFIKGESDINSIIGRLKERATTLAVSGATGEQIREQMAGLLTAAGKADLLIPVNAALELKFGDEGGAYANAEALLKDQIRDTLSRVKPNELESMVNTAFGDQAGAIHDALYEAAFSMDPNAPQPDITDFIPSPTEEQVAAWDKYKFAIAAAGRETTNLFAASGESVADWNELSNALATAASNMPLDQFWAVAKSLDVSGLSANQFATSMGDMYGETSQLGMALRQMSDSGYTTQQMLQGISLVTSGVISSWAQLQAMGPAYLEVIYNTHTAEQSVGSAVGTSLLDQAKAARDAAIAGAGSGGGSGGGGGGGGGSGASDALNKRKKAIQDYYDKEIEKIKDSEKAKKDAADAEKRRLERQKRDMNTLIGYREALAAGDFAAAAKAKIQLDTDRKADALDDQRRNEESAAEKRIKILEDERDKKIEAIDKALDAAKSANSKSVASTKAAAGATSTAWDKTIKDIEAAVAGLPTDFATNMDKLITIAKEKGLSVAGTIQSSLKSIKWAEGFEDTGDKIWGTIKTDLVNAPWHFIGNIIESAMDGNEALLNAQLNALKVYMITKPTDEETRGSWADAAAARNKASGGRVWGAGTATSDSIPAMLSNGEYVIKAASVQKYGQQIFDILNGGFVPAFAGGGLAAMGHYGARKAMANGLFGFANGGMARYSMGGYASPMGYAMGGSVANNTTGGNIYLTMHINEPGCSPEEIWQLFERKMRRETKKVGYSR